MCFLLFLMISFHVQNAVDYSTALLEHMSEEDFEVVNMTAKNSFRKLIARLLAGQNVQGGRVGDAFAYRIENFKTISAR